MTDINKDLEFTLFDREEIITPIQLVDQHFMSLDEAREKLEDFYHTNFKLLGALFYISYMKTSLQTIMVETVNDRDLQESIKKLETSEHQIFDISLQCVFPLHTFRTIEDMQRQIYNLNSVMKSEIIEIDQGVVQSNYTRVMTAISVESMDKMKTSKIKDEPLKSKKNNPFQSKNLQKQNTTQMIEEPKKEEQKKKEIFLIQKKVVDVKKQQKQNQEVEDFLMEIENNVKVASLDDSESEAYFQPKLSKNEIVLEPIKIIKPHASQPHPILPPVTQPIQKSQINSKVQNKKIQKDSQPSVMAFFKQVK